ncbi:MAG: hypothetical protein ACAI43_12545 [Phycisphaerae bacterium]|nr:hypothetical protein [Tepidisphaeraceae bacterium]
MGRFVHDETSWAAWRLIPDDSRVLVWGSGSRPSREQVATWKDVEPRIAELVEAATATIAAPPVRIGLFRRRPTATQWQRFTLREIGLEEGGFELFFDSPLSQRIGLWPVVRYEGGRVVSAEWAT